MIKNEGIVLSLISVCALWSLILLRTAEDSPVETYDRESWGRWRLTEETGANGCRWDTRHLLLRDSAHIETLETREKKDRRCMVLSGTWTDAYTGKTHTVPAKEMHIDHLVSLAEAHRSGGADWPPEKKKRFFNDSGNHVVTHASTNIRKSDTDVAGQNQRRRRVGWWPPDKRAHCAYAKHWKRVKRKWNLSSDLDEARALNRRIALCARRRE